MFFSQPVMSRECHSSAFDFLDKAPTTSVYATSGSRACMTGREAAEIYWIYFRSLSHMADPG